eukprot:TRINITY_DN35000_c0_g1_i1.p1 TRINITY_DN35000_c0_g1~~TRINITY_DN35000_c0_g1_i1.p1  ORF type:complete len:286 (+),score=35.87 TRINITY_DN35000_c0_g1_i1:65-859(+)
MTGVNVHSDPVLSVTVSMFSGDVLVGPDMMPKDSSVRDLCGRLLTAPKGFALENLVEMRDMGDSDWELGIVTSLDPLEARAESARKGRIWDEMRQRDALAKTGTLKLCVASRPLEDYELLGEVAGEAGTLEITAIFSNITEEQRRQRKQELRNLAKEAQMRTVSCDEEDVDEDEEEEWLNDEVNELFARWTEAECNDRDLIAEVFKHFGIKALKRVPEILLSDRTFLLEALRRGAGNELVNAMPDALKADEAFMVKVTDALNGD